MPTHGSPGSGRLLADGETKARKLREFAVEARATPRRARRRRKRAARRLWTNRHETGTDLRLSGRYPRCAPWEGGGLGWDRLPGHERCPDEMRMEWAAESIGPAAQGR
jgi:hypothetical protein